MSSPKNSINVLSISERICFHLNKLFKPQKDLEALRNDPSAEGRAEYSYKVAKAHFEESLEHIKYDRHIKNNVLDLGCGYGGMVAVLSERQTGILVGIDIDLISLTSAKHFINSRKRLNDRAHLVLGSADELPFSSRKFGLIYTIATMEHFNNPQKVLEECRRVLQRDGQIFIVFSPYYAYNGAHLFDFINIPWCHLLFSEKTLIRVWKKLATDNPEMAKLNPVVDLKNDTLTGINKMSVRAFKKSIKESGLKVLKYKECTYRRWYLKFLQKMPLLKELLTIKIIIILAN